MKPGYGPVVLLCSRRPVAHVADASPVNWSHAFSVVLEKHGYCDTRLWEYDDFRRALSSGEQPGAIFVGPCRDAGLAREDIELLQSFECPLFVEAQALSPSAARHLGIARRPAGAARTIVARSAYFEPVTTALCGLMQSTPAGAVAALPAGRVTTRYEPPDPRVFAARDDDDPGTLAARAVLKLAYALCRRSAQADDGLPFPQPASSRTAAVGLALLAGHLGDSDRDYLCGCAARIVAALPPASAPPLAPATLAAAVAEGDTAVLPGLLAAALPAVDGDVPAWSPADEFTAMPVVRQVEAVARSSRTEAAATLFARLARERLDHQRMAFFNHPGDAQRRYINHPLLLVGAAFAKLPLRAVLPSWIGSRECGISSEQAALWCAPPPGGSFSPHARTGVDEIIMGYGDDDGAAVWRHGDLVMLGPPLLALSAHAHTLPPLDAAFFHADSHAALVLEALLMAAVEHRLCASDKLVARTCHWPRGGRAPLVLRHDVDRHPGDTRFDELQAAYAQRGMRAAWYWIPGRVDAARVAALAASGHEIGLHAVSGRDKRTEFADLRALGVEVAGECYHGAGAEYHRGALSVQCAIAAGAEYSELNPCVYGLPYRSFPWVEPDGALSYRDDCVHLTFNYTTDGIPGQTRKTDVTSRRELAIATLELDWYLCVLNHPDVNAGPLSDLLALPQVENLPVMTPIEVARWWQATHRYGSFALAADNDELVMIAHALPPGTMLELLGAHAPPRVRFGGTDAAYAATTSMRPGVTRFGLPDDVVQ